MDAIVRYNFLFLGGINIYFNGAEGAKVQLLEEKYKAQCQ